MLARDVDGEGTGLVDRGRFEAAATQEWGRGGGDGCERPISAPASLVAISEAAGCDVDVVPLPGECGDNQGAFYPPKRENQEVESRRRVIDIISGSRDAENGYYADGEEQLPPSPPPPPGRSNLVLKSRSEPITSNSTTRSPHMVPSGRWQRQWPPTAAAGGSGGDGNGVEAAATTASIARSNSSRSTGSRNARHERSPNCNNSNSIKRPLSQQNLHSLNTLRSLLRQDGVFQDDCPAAMADLTNNDSHHRQSSFDSENRGSEHRGRRLHEQEQNYHRPRFRQETTGFKTRAGVGGGGGGGAGRARLRDNTPSTAATEAQDLATERAAAAARAENILWLRSRGDLVGLRRVMSKADPSASGVVSQREMERVVLRRFGTGLAADEARELATRHRKEYNGRSMVDYNRLCDTLEAKEAGIFGGPAGAALSSSTSSLSYAGRGRGRVRRGEEQQQQERLLSSSSRQDGRDKGMGAATSGSIKHAAGGRTRYNQKRYSRRGVPDLGFAVGGSGGENIRVEESQLVRRARAKTLALLERFGTLSVDCVFGQVDPGVCVYRRPIYVLVMPTLSQLHRFFPCCHSCNCECAGLLRLRYIL